MSYKSHKTAPTRTFDHLYDPLYITSSTKDIWKANIQSLSQSAPFHIVPIYKTMFSDLPQCSRNIYLMQENPLPRPPTISYKDEHLIIKPADINGKHRANYFTHPSITGNLNVAHPRKQPNIISENNRQRSVLYSLPIIEEQTSKTVACQTIYREQSAQTRSWMPPLATINKDTTLSMETSEIVHISNVLQNADADEDGNNDCNTLLPDIFQIKIIERSRKRREWERSLPPIKTFRDWNKRRCIMEAFEWEEWIAREEEIDHYQNVRLLIVKEMMDERTENHFNANAMKMDNTKNRHMVDRDRKFVKLRNIHRRCMRKLEKKHDKYTNGNVMKEYIDETSELHGSQQQHSQYHPKYSHFIDDDNNGGTRKCDSKRIDLSNNIHTIIPMKLDDFIKQKSIDITKPKIPIQEIQPGFCQENALTDLYNTLKALRNQKIVNQDIIKCLKYIKLPITDPSDIQLDMNRVQYEKEQEQEYQNALLLQKLIKGRVSQKVIFNGRNKCKSLILEYQSAHQLGTVSALYPSQLNEISEKHKCVLYQQSRLEGLLRAEAQINDLLHSATGSSFSFLLNFLDKELTRLIEQKKGHALYLLAERERQQREAIEEQQKQREEHQRQEITEFLEKKINSTSETVTTYLENILLESIQRISDADARQQIRNVAKEIDQITARSMASGGAYDQSSYIPNDEEVISDLVNNFMFPEIYQRIARRDLALKKRSALFAAHTVIYDDLKNIYPIRERLIENNEIIATSMVNEIINDILPSPSSSSASVVSSSHKTNSIRHNNKNKIFEGQHNKKCNYKTSHELIVNATISDILKSVIPGEACACDVPNNKRVSSDDNVSSSDNQESLKAIANEINEELYNYAIGNDHDEQSAMDKKSNL